jgi:serine/threonine-protein kinase RsbT
MSIITLNSEVMHVVRDLDVVPFRNRARQYAAKIGMGMVNQVKLVTAASELARNMLKYAKGGTVSIEEIMAGVNKGVRLRFMDKGPGIENIRLALEDGYTTGNGLGLGLPGSRRLVSEFEIQSQVGIGTTVTIIKWKNG